MRLLKITDIKVIGFDLDQTLYPKSSEIDIAIQRYIYKQISKKKNCSLESAKKLFLSYYPGLGGSSTLVKLGFHTKEAEEIVQSALEKADIANFLKPNPKVLKLLKDLKKKYGSLSLITGSCEKLAKARLEKLGIPIELFDLTVFGDISKRDGSAYKKWFKHFKKKDSLLQPKNFLYIGDRKLSDIDIPIALGMNAVLVNVMEKDSDVKVPQLSSALELRELLI